MKKGEYEKKEGVDKWKEERKEERKEGRKEGRTTEMT